MIQVTKRALIVFVLICASFPHFWFAQELCSTCWKAPKDLEKYFEVVDKLVDHMTTLEGKKPTVSEKTKQELEGENDPKTRTIQFGEDIKSARELSRQLTTSILVNQLIEDPFIDIKISQSGESRKRDRDLLIEKDRKIMTGLRVIEKWWYVGVAVPDSVLSKVDTELKKLEYAELWKNGDDFNMKLAWARYEDLAEMVWRLNWMYKKLHKEKYFHDNLKDIGVGNLITEMKDPLKAKEVPELERIRIVWKQLDTITDDYFLPLTWNKGWEGLEWIKFTEDKRDMLRKMWQIQDDYDCAIGTKNLCEDGKTWWWKNIAKDSWEETKNIYITDKNKAENTFKDAFSRLKWALFMGDVDDKDAAQQRENQLLNSIYWRDIPEYKKRWKLEEVQYDEKWEVVATPVVWNWLKWFLTRRMMNWIFDVTTRNNGSLTQSRMKASAEAVYKELKNKQVTEGELTTEEEKKNRIEELKEKLEEIDDRKRTEESIDSRSFLQVSAVQREASSFRSTYENMLAFQEELEERSVLTDPLEFTKQFPKLSQAVYRNIEYIGDKDDTNMMYHSMANVCETQCASNVQWKCWYHTN